MFSDTNTGTKILPLYTAMVWPTKSGVIVERRLQVLMAVFLPPLSAPSTLFIRCVSTKAPFLSERAIVFPYTFFGRRRTINRSVRLLLRVFLPLAFLPQGDTG